MGDIAEYLIEQQSDSWAMHIAGLCDGPCQHCEKEGDGYGKKKIRRQSAPKKGDLRDKGKSKHFSPSPTQQVRERSVTCGDCGSPMVLKESKYGSFYGCSRFPECRGTHGANKNGKPFGDPADAATRAKRVEAHAALDQLWNPKRPGSRVKVYRWMAKKMGLSSGDAHIGKFNLEQCQQLILLVKQRTEQV